MTVVKYRKYIIICILTIILMAYCMYKIYPIIKSENIKKAEEEQNTVEEKNNIQEENMVSANNAINIIQENTIDIVVPKKEYEGYEMIATLEIPSIGIQYPVLAETSEELMKISLNKYWGSNPNEVGNFCIVGHNYKSGKHFGKLKYVNIGDEVQLTDNLDRMLTYEVYKTYVIDPYDTSCTSQLTDGKKEITLITCTNAGKDRLVVKAREIIKK